jgi:hypothetical protein
MAIEVYESIRSRQAKEGFGKDEDYVFQPEHQNRDYALQQLHRQFDHLLDITNLKKNQTGEARTLYSLRHTAIMFRLTESKGLDLLSLARAARTSVEMLDRFYAKHLTAEMNVELIQSNRNQSLQDVNTDIARRVNLTKKSNSNSADPTPANSAKAKTPASKKVTPKRTRTSSKLVQTRQP